jgi:arylsulfatase A
MAGRPGGTGGVPTKYTQAKIGLSLFDLEKDIGETTNLKDRYPDVTERLSALGKAFDADLRKTRRPAGRL